MLGSIAGRSRGAAAFDSNGHGAGPLRLHLGCGGNAPAGWVNVDKSFGPAIERLRLKRILKALGLISEFQASWKWPTNVVRLDIAKEWPWPDGSAEAIYSSHMVEHFGPQEAVRFLERSARVLRPGGVLRLAVPDLEATVSQYSAEHAAGQTAAADTLNELFYNAPITDGTNMLHRAMVALLHRPHSWMYDFESLALRMREAGFEDITRGRFGEGRLPDVKVLDVRPESLFIEGIRVA